MRLRHLVWKELLELRRDPRLFGIVVMAPIIQLTMLGYAATTDVTNVPVVVVDADRSPASRELVQRFDGSRYFTVVGTVGAVQDVEPWLERGLAWLALVVPSGYQRDIATGRSAVVQVVADGTDANSTNVALGYAASLVAGYAQEIVETRGGRGVTAPPLDARIRVWFNPRLESRDFMIPGIVALLLLVVTTNLSSMAIVREKELGTFEQLSVTPIARWELIVGKLLPYGLVGLLDVRAGHGRRAPVVPVPLRRQPLAAARGEPVYLMTTLGLGLFVSTISRTQQQAMMTATFFFLMPMLYFSGFIFPIENMPAVIQGITYLDSPAVLHHDRARDLPEGRRHRGAVARPARAHRVGHRHPGARGGPVTQDARVTHDPQRRRAGRG
jgi:ABC-2 type transport system permease protein